MLNYMRCSLIKRKLCWCRTIMDATSKYQGLKTNRPQSNIIQEPSTEYGFVNKAEEEKLAEDVFRPDIEKPRLFTLMLRRNSLLNKAQIKHHSQD